MKQQVKLNEAQLRRIVAESVRRVLKEYDQDFHHVTIDQHPLDSDYGVYSIPYGDMGHYDGTLKQCQDYAPNMEKEAEERFQKDVQHAIEAGMSEKEMNKILHDTYAKRGKYIPTINKGAVSWNAK